MADSDQKSAIRFVLFDWGDTLMKDDPTMTLPMARWPRVESVPGAVECLERLHHPADAVTRPLLALATGAEVSVEAEIRQALARVGLDEYLDRIFCFKNVGVQKPDPVFYSKILAELGASPNEALMVGDHFERDVLAANRVGMRAVWFNPKTSEDRSDEMYCTIHRLEELPELLFPPSLQGRG